MSQVAPFPLTALQEAYLVGASPMVDLGGFFPTYYVELEVLDLDLDRARAALDQVLNRHDHLRTVVDAAGSQRVLPPERTATLPWSVADLTGLEDDEQVAAIHHTRDRMCRSGVDPTTWPLVEIAVNRRCVRRTRIHLAMSLLLLDGPSIHQVVDEWRAFYHDPGACPPVAALTYRESRMLLLEHERTSRYQDQWRYWEHRLDHLPAAPQLPLAGQRPAGQGVRFTRRTCGLTREQWARLSGTFRRHRVLPTTGLCHLFAEVLGAWAAEPRFALNLLHQNWASGRPPLEGVVGQFGATLPLEVDLRRSTDFWERARRLQRQMLTDLQHADVPGVHITRELAARRGWTTRAVLPYVFTSALRGAGGPGTRRGGAPATDPFGCRVVFSELRTPQVLVDNQLHDRSDGGVDCIWDTVDDAFPHGLTDLMFTAYQRMVEDLCRTPPGAAPPDPTDPGHRAVVDRLNGPLHPAPRRRLEEGFLRSAAREPTAVAVRTAGRTLTYGDLEARSRAVADWLAVQGVGRGHLVPVVMTKGWEQVVAVLGVLRAGAAYCPVDAALPAERIDLLLRECSATVALVQSAGAPGTGGHDVLGHVAHVLSVDRVEPAAGAGPGPRHGEPDDLAYVIHTSGSTGRPKGVMIRHGAAVNTVEDVSARVGLTGQDRVFGISSLSFDLSVWDVFATLTAGASLVLPDAGHRPDPLGWAQAAARHRVTVWNSVPALAQLLVEAVEQRPSAGVPPLRAFLLSGDWVPTTLPGRLRRHWPRARVLAMGGATEASIWSNVHEVRGVVPTWRSIPYGVPLRRQSVRVLDHRLEPRPPWAVGQIYIGGVGLADGYWRDPAGTDERFVRHPVTGERLYATGDQGCYWPDGTIEFRGRVDRQLKIQGHRVEPGEVEAAIRGYPGVRDCVVSGRGAEGRQRRLVALVVPRAAPDAAGTTLDAGEVLDHLRGRLPHYLVPDELHVLGCLPLSPQGKVDVAGALAALAGQDDQGRRGGGHAAPVGAAQDGDGPLVQRLCTLWAELLGLRTVTADGDFFALGGNSLLVLRLVHRLRVGLGLDLPFGQVFETATPRALAAHLTAPTAAVPTTQDVRSAVAGLLDVAPGVIGDTDNLIRHGMDSLRMMQLVGRWRRDGVAVTFRELAEDPTVRHWHELLTARGAGDGAGPHHAGAAAPPGVVGAAPFDLTPVQRAYWIGRGDELALGGVGCHAYLELDGRAVQAARLETAVREVAARHGMLRARFLPDGRQQVLDRTPWPGLTVHDLVDAGPAAAERALAQVREGLSHRRLDVASGEVFDVRLSLRSGDRSRIHLNIDLLVADVASIGLVLADIATAYLAPGTLPPVDGYGFAQYLADHRAWVGDPHVDGTPAAVAQAYWRSLLPGMPGTGPLLPLATSPDRVVRPRFSRRTSTVPAQQWRSITERARRHALTPAMVLATAYAEVLGARSQEPEFLLNVPLFDRQPLHQAVATMVADFTNLVLLHVDLRHPVPFRDRVSGLQRQVQRSASHAQYSTLNVLRDLRRARGGRRVGAPVVFACNLGSDFIAPQFRAELGELTWMLSQTPQVWLDHQVYRDGDGVLLAWDAVDELFPAGLLDHMLLAYRGLLSALAAGDEAWTSPVAVTEWR